MPNVSFEITDRFALVEMAMTVILTVHAALSAADLIQNANLTKHVSMAIASVLVF